MTGKTASRFTYMLGATALFLVAGCATTYDPPSEEGEEPIDEETEVADLGMIGGIEGDVDGDGFAGHADCDDGDASIHPDADEVCDDVDNNCNGIVDEGYDADGDGFTECGGDCDDTDGRVYPGAPDLCDGVADNDCDGLGDPMEIDHDLDAYSECNGDCDDDNPWIYPNAPDICEDTWDNDCDGVWDEMDLDNDQDGYSECNGDCDDTDAEVHPLAQEKANGIDDDCDGFIDED